VDWRQGDGRYPPQSTRKLETAVWVSLPARAPLVWFTRLSKPSSGLMPYGFGIPASWFAIHLAGFAPEAPGSIEPWVASADFGATSEYDPSLFAPAILGARALPRFPAPTAQPIRRGPPLPDFACPGHVASLHLPCASTPSSLAGLPGFLSPRRALGASPFRASPVRDHLVSRRGFPSCD
jgi:hypothetical protein